MCCCVVQVTVSDATAPDQFSCQLTSSRLSLELLCNNMNECYVMTSRRHSQQHDDNDEASRTALATACLDTSASIELGSRHTGNLERPLGVHQGDISEDSPATDEPLADDDLCHDDDDDEVDNLLLTADDLQPGMCCAALFASDSSWYRAKVKSIDGDVVQIVFVDYGTESAVSVADLRRLKDRFTATKMMLFQCCLEGWQDTVDLEVADRFQELVLDHKLIADVISTAGECGDGVKYVVRLLDMGLSIGDRLKNPDAYKPVAVCVTSATSPHDFWCHCVDDESTTELPLLMDRIADLYSAAADDQLSSELAIDDDDMLYAARYTDGVWYRAKIISSHQSCTPATVDVLFVDYGTKTEVLACDLRVLPDSCRTLPPQAVHCRLAGVEPTTDNAALWDDASMSRFVELVMCTDDERAFELHPVNVVYSAEGEIVEMSGKLMSGDMDVGSQLVDSGYAVDCASVIPGGHSGIEHRRRSSDLSDQRCNLFVSFDAGSGVANEFTAVAASDDVVTDGVAEADRQLATADDKGESVAVKNVESGSFAGDDIEGDGEDVVPDTFSDASDLFAAALEGRATDGDDGGVMADVASDIVRHAAATDDEKMEDEFTEAVESLGKLFLALVLTALITKHIVLH